MFIGDNFFFYISKKNKYSVDIHKQTNVLHKKRKTFDAKKIYKIKFIVGFEKKKRKKRKKSNKR